VSVRWLCTPRSSGPAALAGAASGSFASSGPPTLAPIESSEAFLAAYQDVRGRLFTAAEREIAWAASLWMAAYNARELALHAGAPVSGDALGAQTFDAADGEVVAFRCTGKRFLPIFLASFVVPSLALSLRRE
jgi:hypothetical protein